MAWTSFDALFEIYTLKSAVYIFSDNIFVSPFSNSSMRIFYSESIHEFVKLRCRVATFEVLLRFPQILLNFIQ